MPTLAQGAPTGAIYGFQPHRETRAEQLPSIDVDRLVGALVLDSSGHTDVTPRHHGLLAGGSSSPDALVYTGSGTLLIAQVAIFESTPSTIEQTWAWPRQVPPDPAIDPPAYASFKALGRWLDAEDAAVADMVGVGRTTPYTWKRDGREPRAGTAQRVYEHYATVDSLRRRLGIAGLRRWLHEGVPTRRDRLLAGGLASLEVDVHAILFRREPSQRIDLAAAPENPSPAQEPRGERALRPSRRRPRRSGG